MVVRDEESLTRRSLVPGSLNHAKTGAKNDYLNVITSIEWFRQLVSTCGDRMMFMHHSPLAADLAQPHGQTKLQLSSFSI